MQAGAPGSLNYKVMDSRPAKPLSLGFQEQGRQSIFIEILPYVQPALEDMPLPWPHCPPFAILIAYRGQCITVACGHLHRAGMLRKRTLNGTKEYYLRRKHGSNNDPS